MVRPRAFTPTCPAGSILELDATCGLFVVRVRVHIPYSFSHFTKRKEISDHQPLLFSESGAKYHEKNVEAFENSIPGKPMQFGP